MPLPAAIVSLTLEKLSGLQKIGIAKAKHAYAVATIGSRFFGRSRRISRKIDEFDFSAEPQKWTFSQPVAAGEDFSLLLEIRNDRGDDDSDLLLSIYRKVEPPWMPGKRTFELIGATLEVTIATHYVPPDSISALVPRSPEDLRVPAVVVVPNVIMVELSNIRGLYMPAVVPTPMRSEQTPGYRSEDDKGRIFLNRDLDGKYARKEQLVEATVKVAARRGALPPDAKVHWTVINPSDPFDGDPHLHRQWTHYINEKAYDADGDPTGAKGVNEGKLKSPRWEEVAPYSLEDDSKKTEAKTKIVAGESKVVMRCPDVAGDILVLRATVESDTKIEVFPAETGVMTMWHRIDVEYIKMTSALDMPIDDVAPYLEPMCAEINIVERTVVADQQFMSSDDDHLSEDSSKFIEANAKHVKDPGWFFVVAAMEPHTLPAKPGGVLWQGTVDLMKYASGTYQGEYFEIPGVHMDADYVTVTWPGHSADFVVFSPQTVVIGGVDHTRLWILGNDHQPEFTAGDGSHDHAYKQSYDYSPRGMTHGGTWTDGGYGAPDKVDIEVLAEGASYTSGVSPSIFVSSKAYFGARIVMFTHHGFYCDYYATPKTKLNSFDADITADTTHEIVHAFGMPHKCGYYDYWTPRDTTCLMNYRPDLMIDDKKALIPGSAGKIGTRVCGRHIKEVRRVHLEDNLGLQSLGW